MNDFTGIALGFVAATPVGNLAQLCAGWIAVLPLAALGLYGWFNGIFLAIIAGLQILFSFLIALAWSRVVASWLEMFGCPPGYSLAVAYWLLFAAGVAVIRVGVGGAVPEGVVRFEKLIDHCCGALIGVVAGAVLAGTLLVGWSFTSGSGRLRCDPQGLPFDAGRRVLWTFARWAAPTEKDAEGLVDGDSVRSTGDGNSVRASEPFVDINGNGLRDPVPGAMEPEAEEPFRDIDGNGSFTADMRLVDHNKDGVRAIGLLDCYQLADWRRVRCQHAPRITSVDLAAIVEEGPVEEAIYTVTAQDVDPGDVVTFGVKPLDGANDIDVSVNVETGVVTLLKPADFEKKRTYKFVVEAVDKAGLTDQKVVTVSVKDKPD